MYETNVPLDWRDLQSFLAVAEAGGLSGAARATGTSAPTLGRRMRALERRLGRDLFVRRTHGYDLTEAGSALRDRLRGVEASIARATHRSAGDTLPLVKLGGGTWTLHMLAAAVPSLVGDPPDVRLRLVAGENVLSIRRREAAIGLRNARPEESGLAGRRLRTVRFAAYGAADASRWIVSDAATPSATWARARAERDGIACEVTQPRLALDLALAGIGRAVLPTFVGDAEPRLKRTGGFIEELEHEQWLVTHQDDRDLPEIRRVIDRLVASLR